MAARSINYSRIQKLGLSEARLCAFYILDDVFKNTAYLEKVSVKYFCMFSLSAPDKALAWKICCGVIQYSGALDVFIARALNSKASRSVRTILRMAVYEMFVMDVRSDVAVNQGVSLAKYVSARASGLVNAVLRRVSGMKEEFLSAEPCVRLGFPSWIDEALQKVYSAHNAENFMQVSNEEAPLFIFLNALVGDVHEIQDAIKRAGFALQQAQVSLADGNTQEVSHAFRVTDKGFLHSDVFHTLYSEGKILIVDAASVFVAQEIIQSIRPKTLLEIGTGSGNKTILLQNFAQEILGEQIAITCVEKYEFKVAQLKKRLAQYGAHAQNVVCADATKLEEILPQNKAQQFDCVFLDAPCSGLGTLRRHLEIRWRLNVEDIEALTALQKELVSSALAYVGSNSTFAYATCTVLQEENEELVDFALRSTQKILQLQNKFRLQLTSGGSDAHFLALLKS